MSPPEGYGQIDPALIASAPATAQVLLIVDDDPVVRSLMRDTLEDDGFAVIEAGNGAEACERCNETPPALIVVDAMMPVMDGFELCRALRARPETARTPILMATGLDDSGSIARAFEVGATDFIAKPLNWLMLSQRVRYMLRAAGAFDELRENQERLMGALGELRENQERLIAARDAAEAANKAKSEFLANMSHELRTPLNAIIGFASIMHQSVRGALDPAYVNDAKIIVDSGTHLLTIINAILDIAKADSNSLDLAEDMVDIAELVHSSAKNVAEWARRGEIACAYDLAPGLPPVWGDSKKLRQVMTQLLSNAIKFTPAGGRMTLSARREENGGLAISIADTGIGIAPEQMAIALAPFGQVDSSLARQYEGIGLGLPLAKRLVELHDGALEIDSTLGAGTTITVRLPAERVMGDRAAA